MIDNMDKETIEKELFVALDSRNVPNASKIADEVSSMVMGAYEHGKSERNLDEYAKGFENGMERAFDLMRKSFLGTLHLAWIFKKEDLIEKWRNRKL